MPEHFGLALNMLRPQHTHGLEADLALLEFLAQPLRLRTLTAALSQRKLCDQVT